MNINRHTIIAGSLAFILLAGLSSILYDDSSNLSLLLKERLMEKEKLFDELRKMQNGPVEKLVMDYSYWQDMVNYVKAPTDGWASENIDTSFSTYNYQYLWIYRQDGVLIRSVRKDGVGVKQGIPFPLPLKRVESLIAAGNKLTQFCIMTPRGVMEVYAAPIRAPKDKREENSHGLLLAGVLLDEKYLLELSRLSRSSISLQELDASSREAVTAPREGAIFFSRSLTGIDGRPLKTIAVRMVAPDIQQLVRQKDKNAFIGTALIAVLYLLAGFILMSRQRLKIANLNLDAAQQAARMGSWQRNIENGTSSWSDNLYTIFGLQKSGTKPCLETFYNLVHPEDISRVRSTFEQAIAAKEGHELEFRLIRPDGEVRNMRSKGSVLVVEGLRASVVGYTQDITELARITNELVALNSQKDGFITMLSHDLRTPLTPLTILLPMIRKRVEDHELIKLVDICCKSSASIRKLTDKARMLVTLFDKINRGALENVALVSVVEQSLVENAEILTHKKIIFRNDINTAVAVQAIPVQLKELFANLLSNAVRFSSEGGIIRISAEQKNGTVTVAVHDDGIGLEHDHLERIFDEFFKADESRHELDAPGLGLAICRRIVRNHHGRIWAESPGLGKGTTIKFSINEQGFDNRYNVKES